MRHENNNNHHSELYGPFLCLLVDMALLGILNIVNARTRALSDHLT